MLFWDTVYVRSPPQKKRMKTDAQERRKQRRIILVSKI